ncbi:uncharacterized protein LOC134536806 [Bacillus rossius redtenbacheri]|uniref:uncharacterized protein LOC134536806 n=1 Tax=Bacillus rossius redtenbacheri TaxID=93214 RepID=UPI002FDDDF24
MSDETRSNLTREDLEQMLATAISDHEVTSLTQPGDNMGSVLLAVKVTLKTGKVFSLVAKMYPENAVAVQVFNSPVTMRKEIDMYTLVAPEFQRIQEDSAVPPPRRLDVFCTCVAARASRRAGDDGSRLANDSSVILLENLKSLGYSCTDRIAGMDLEHAEMVVSHLARFHATAVAIKTTKPLLFRNKVAKALNPVKVRLDDREFEFKMVDGFLEALGRKSPVVLENAEKLAKIFREEMEYKFSDDFRAPLEPYATITHNDLWTNNIMFRHKSSKPAQLKFIDFQLPCLGSPASDLLFFLFTSTADGIVVEHLDRLLKLYHDSFLQWLGVLGCSTKKYSWDSFVRELSIFSVQELQHILFMLNIVMMHKEDAEKMSEDLRDDNFGGPPELNDDLVQRASQIVSVYAERGWL